MFSMASISRAPVSAATEESAGVDPFNDVRIRRADRSQVSWGPIDLDSQLPPDHEVRAIVALIERLDLSALYAQIVARGTRAGAPAIDPKILLALWVYATSEGETSAREIERLTTLHTAYRWVCGGVSVSYHTLADFRSQQNEVLDDLVTQVLALLMKQNLIELKRVAQDGTRVRASAGANSFRRQGSLEEMMLEARAHLDKLAQEAADPTLDKKRSAARKRAAEERIARLEAAARELPEIAATKKKSGAKDKEPRVSTTDPDARVMKMGDGGFRPAVNVQFATTTDKARVIVGVSVTNRGSDMNEAAPMLEQIERRTGQMPDQTLVDGGYVGHATIDATTQKGVVILGPVPKPREGDTRDRYAPRDTDSQPVAEWRQRMSTEEAKEIYKLRAATAETVNADAKQHRGLDHMPVRGLEKALGCALLFALTYDLLRALALGVLTT